jgi:formate dehydrogenase gamma subunit
MHWAIAVPFLVSYFTALLLVVIYNPDRTRPYRDLFSWVHRISGVALIALPMLAAFHSRGDFRVHFHNIRQAWTWMFDDIKWLSLMLLAAISDRIRLPEQGKFNAAEKLNFMVLLVTYPLYVLTGLLIWITHVAVLSWLLHFFMALLATPLILGHLFMALLSRSGRPGLQGMISGFVDRQWAKHHYRRWYREHHEASEELSFSESSAHLAMHVAEQQTNALEEPAPPASLPEREELPQ